MNGELAGGIPCLHPELMLESNAATSPELFREMLALASRRENSLNVELALGQLVEREREFPSALGQCVAMPHLHLRELPRRLLTVARLQQGMDMHAMDDKPVSLVFLLLSPAGDTAGHLATLRQIGILCNEASRREKMITSASPVELLQLIEGATQLRRLG